MTVNSRKANSSTVDTAIGYTMKVIVNTNANSTNVRRRACAQVPVHNVCSTPSSISLPYLDATERGSIHAHVVNPASESGLLCTARVVGSDARRRRCMHSRTLLWHRREERAVQVEAQLAVCKCAHGHVLAMCHTLLESARRGSLKCTASLEVVATF